VSWRRLAALPVALAAAVAAIPVAFFVGLGVASVLNRNVRLGRSVSMEDGLFGAAAALVLVGPWVIGLGAAACALAGLRSRMVGLGAPFALIVAFAVPAALFVTEGAPDPSPIERRDLPALRQISAPPRATSDPATTFNNSGEWESIEWITQRFDHVASQTTASGALRHYTAALQSAGWHTDTAESDDRSRMYISGRRDGRRITVAIPHDLTQAVRLSIR
jgi:hypothetical protein